MSEQSGSNGQDVMVAPQPLDAVAEIETADLRTTLQAGRGAITDFSTTCPDCIRPPDLIIGEVTRALMNTYFGHVLVLGTSLFRIPDAEVAAQGIILLDGRFQWCDQLNIDAGYAGRHHRGLPARLKTLRRKEIDRDVVLLVGNGYRMYGHWIIDYLPKLYLLNLAGYRLDRLDFLLPADTPGFAREWLRLLGIEDRQLVLYDCGYDLVVCRSLIVPTGLRFLNRVSPLLSQARAFLLGRIEPKRFRWIPPQRDRGANRRLLVARTQNDATINRRRLVQRNAFEAMAAARGFAIVSPETMPVRDQIALFRSAGAIYGEYGSGLHASFFSEPGTVVVAARSNDPGLGFVQSAIDQAVAHAGGYVIGGPPDPQGDFSVHDEDLTMGFDWLDWRSFA